MLNLIYIVLSILLVLIAAIILIRILNKRKIREQKLKNIENLNNIKLKYEEIKSELERCKKISKNPQTKDLLLNWDKEYNILEEGLSEIIELEVELEELEEKSKTSKYMKRSKIFNSTIDYFLKFAQEYYSKLKNFTAFELDNTQMAIDLKERLKELNNMFEQQVKIYGFLSEGFIAKVAEIKVKINEFEKEQKEGNYPTARVYLKEGNDLLLDLENTVKIVIDYYKGLSFVDELISAINSEKILLQKYKYLNYEKKLEADFKKYQIKKDYFVEKIERVELDDKDLLITYIQELEFFIQDLKEYATSLNITSVKINEIETIKKYNEEKIQLAQELIAGCQEEKETIKKLYNINNISQFDKISDQEESFEKFKIDYEKLINIILKEDKNFIQYEENIMQTNKYLERILVNLRGLIKNLEAIRSDEIEIRDKIHKYEKEFINITLYLKEYKHFEVMSKNLVSNYNEIESKLEELSQELEKEPLDIGLVRVLNDVIEKLLIQFAIEAQKDIKQRQGVEKLMLFYNRFVVNDEYAKFYSHFLSLYNEKEYRQILRETHTLLAEASEKGEELYKSIVSTIKITDYKSML